MAKTTSQQETDVPAVMACVEAVLFSAGDPVKKARLAKACGVSVAVLETALAAYAERAQAERRGLVLVEHEGALQMVTAPHTQEALERFVRERLDEDLSTAALEVLTIVAYRGPVARAEVDAIRGVNCAFSLRGLLMRGLIERVPDPERKRTYRYRVTHDFLTHLGLARVEDLPDYEQLRAHPKIAQVQGVAQSS